VSHQTLEALGTSTAVVRVNLLPEGLDDARKLRRLQAGLGVGLVAVVGLVGLAYAVGAGHVSEADDRLGAVQAQTAQLTAEQNRYAEVPKVEARLQAVEDAQVAVTKYDVSWFALLDAIATRAPQGTTYDSVSLALDSSATAPGGAGSAAAADPLGVAGIGTLNLTGKAPDQNAVSTLAVTLDQVPGLGASRITAASQDPATGTITFSQNATITPDALLNGR
jgi:Tfp pilus assembly protein PilN